MVIDRKTILHHHRNGEIYTRIAKKLYILRETVWLLLKNY